MVKRSREDSPPLMTASPSSSAFDSSVASSPSFLEISIPTKYAHISEDLPHQQIAMKCSLPPHHETIAFSTFEEFEIHYAQAHANRCAECHRNFPTEYFLSLHIGENHDPLNEALRAKGEKMVAFVLFDKTRIQS